MAERILSAGKQGKCEQRFVIKFFTAQRETPINIWRHLRQVHKVFTLSQTAVRNWVCHFNADPTDNCLDKPSCGSPRTARKPQVIQRIHRLVQQDARRTVRELALATRISVGTCHKILRQDLKMRKLAARYVPKVLSAEQKQQHVDICRENLEHLHQEPLLLHHVIAGDESWCYCFDPVCKHKSSAWLGRGDACPQSAIRPRSQKKAMLCVFFDDTSVVHYKFTQKTVNRFVYTKILGRLQEQIHRKRPGLWTPGYGRHQCILLHHDNAPAHKALLTRARLVETGVRLLRQPPYLPDLALADFWLFPRLKQVLQGQRFTNVNQLKDHIGMVLRSIPQREFAEAFGEMCRHWQKCIDCGGDYFEGVRHLRPANPIVANP